MGIKFEFLFLCLIVSHPLVYCVEGYYESSPPYGILSPICEGCKGGIACHVLPCLMITLTARVFPGPGVLA